MQEKATKKGDYYGHHLPKGGGEWIGSNPYDLEALIDAYESADAPQSQSASAQQAAGAQVRPLNEAFAPLRDFVRSTLSGDAQAEAQANVLDDVETLQSELEKGPTTDAGRCNRTLKRIAAALPPGVGPLLAAMTRDPAFAALVPPAVQEQFTSLADL